MSCGSISTTNAEKDTTMAHWRSRSIDRAYDEPIHDPSFWKGALLGACLTIGAVLFVVLTYAAFR